MSGIHPLRWMAGGTLTGKVPPADACALCSVPVDPEEPDPFCPECRARVEREREREREPDQDDD